MRKTAKIVVLNCQHCGKEIDEYTRIFEHAPKYCGKCAHGTWEEKQEAILGGFKIWEVSPAGKIKHERVWCHACRISNCEKGFTMPYKRQCENCTYLLKEISQGEALPSGAIRLGYYIWFVDCKECVRGKVTISSGSFYRSSYTKQCSTCIQRNETWLDKNMRTHIRYTISRPHGMTGRILLDKGEKDELDAWFREHSKSKKGVPSDFYRLRKKGEEGKIFAMDISYRKKETASVSKFCRNKLTNAIEHARIDADNLSLSFNSIEAAQEFIAKQMGANLKNFWLDD